MTLTNILMIMAVLLGPVLAIQVTQFLDDRKEKRTRKLTLFKVLMSTRSYRTNWEHVQALNSINLEFNKDDKEEKEVVSAWEAYIDSLGNKVISLEKQYEFFLTLLSKMAVILKYDFNETQIKNSSYAPVAHSNIDSENQLIRSGLIDVLNRQKPLCIFSTNIGKQDSQIKNESIQGFS